MKRTKQQRQLCASNAAHARLANRAEREKNEQKSLYHGACIVRQEKLGRVLTHAEREKVYDVVIRTFW